MRILTPGLYQIVPVENLYGEEDEYGEQEVVGTGFHTAPFSTYAEYQDGLGTALPEGFDLPIGIIDSPVGPAGTLIMTLDLGDFPVDTFGATSINSPLGPLSIARSYALMRTESRTLYPTPNEQDAVNWLVLDLATETPISVEGGRLIIGQDVVDVAAGPDFMISSHTIDGVDVTWLDMTQQDRDRVITVDHVIRAGTDLHVLLMGMVSGEDDGVLAFVDTDDAGLAAIRAIDTDEAHALANDMVRFDGSIGTVLSYRVEGLVPKDGQAMPLAA